MISLPSLLDPIKLAKALWPEVKLYDKQIDILYSVLENDETYVPAGNMLGKDFVAGFICLWVFISGLKLGKTCRVMSTSVKDEHLDVLWAEIAGFASTAKYPLLKTTKDQEAPLVMVHHE